MKGNPVRPVPALARAQIEARSIDYVPLRERHGRVRDQAPFWFLGNFHFLTIAIGFIGPAMHLSLGWTALAAVAGVLLGTGFQAFHASQGAELGLPQMIQSRAQFGYRGVVVPLAAALFTFIGFNVVDTLIAADGIQHVWGVPPHVTTFALAAVAMVLAVWGHDFVHAMFKAMFWISLPIWTLLTVAIVAGYAPIQATLVADSGGFLWVAFATQFAAAASYNITYAPYVSDYSRYLPPTTSRVAIIGNVFAGSALSAAWLIVLGAWLAARTGSGDALVAILQVGNRLGPGLGLALCLTSVGALVAAMGMNAYSASLTFLTGWDSFTDRHPGPALRLIAIAGIVATWVAIALASGSGAITALGATLVLMLYLLCPWTSVNLVDYFLLRKGRYAIVDLARADGIYGAWGLRGLISYAAGLAASVPFFVIPGVWTGPVAAWMGGVDLAWLVGLAVAAGCYLWANRSFVRTDEDAAIARSDAELAQIDAAPPHQSATTPG
jgi:purine-cytosine permease-like protein